MIGNIGWGILSYSSGVAGRVFHCDAYSDKNYELNITTLATIKTVASPSTFPYGIGGIGK